MRILERAAAIAVVLVTAQLAHAVPVNYDEDVNGDIPGIVGPTPSFNFDIGSNTVAGNAGIRRSTNDFDFDQFRFVIPEFAQLNSVMLEFGEYDFTSDLVGFGANYSIWTDFRNQQLVQSTQEVLGGRFSYHNVLATSGPQSLFTALPLGAGAYDWTHSLVISGFGDLSVASASWDYRLTFDVSSIAPTDVPEPGTIGLMLVSGLLLTIASRRRKARVSQAAAALVA